MVESFVLSFIRSEYLKTFFISLIVISSLCTCFHIVMFKREPKAALGWLIFVISSPIFGIFTYVLFGINQLQRKAAKLNLSVSSPTKDNINFNKLDKRTKSILKVGESLSFSPFCSIDSVKALNNGDQAYPEMLKAINEAKCSITLLSYIFVVDSVGREFVSALEKASKRGVSIKFLVDGVGSQATLGQLSRMMSELNIEFRIFLPVLWRPKLVNMRNHRKILVVDAEIAFTGGMNIEELYWKKKSNKEQALDCHFRLEGSVVNYIQAVFADDWFYCSGELLDGPLWFKPREVSTFDSNEYARVIVSGPGSNNQKMQWHFINAINRARKSIRIATPYFLPSLSLSTALVAASQRGVQVDIVTPEKSDYSVISWATKASLHEILKYGCRVWFSPSPFDHSKILVIDDDCVSFGSANWDVRSLRLNFEMNIEVYSKSLADDVKRLLSLKKEGSNLYTFKDYKKRSVFEKFRGGLARLGSPYL